MRKIFLIGLIALLCLPVIGMASITVTIQDLGLAPQTIKIFNSTGGLVDTINTTEAIVLGGAPANETLYTFQLQPSYTNRSPSDFLDMIFSFLQEYTIPLIIALLFLLVIFGGGRNRR